MSDDVEWWVNGSLPGLSGTHSKAALYAMLSQFLGSTRDGALPVVIKGITAEGDRVAVEGESQVPLQDGRVYANQYHWLFEVRDGTVRQAKEYMDTAHVQNLLFRR